jgi:large subunit ribosomal protein L25
MAHIVNLNATRRSDTGKGVARKLRAAGRIPAVLYGHGRDPEPLSVAVVDVEKALQGISAESTVIDLAVDGTPTQILIREIQRHPTRMNITHLDFYEIHAGETLTVEVPVRLTGTAEGVRNSGGVLEQFLRELEIEVLPRDIPEHIDVDVTELSVGDSIHVRDVSVPNAEILNEPDTTICTVVPPRVEEEPTVAVAEEGEVAEPELIRRAKPEEEEEEAGEESPE